MPDVRSLGARAEDSAAEYLLNLGYVLVGRRVRVGALEIDIIAIDQDVLVFVEVKSSRVRAIPASENLNQSKIARLEEAALRYAQQNQWEDRPIRFDFIAIDQGRLTHHIAAFADG